MSENAIKSEPKPILRGEKGYFLEGTAAGPGRPAGSKSIKDAVRKWLEDNPDDFEVFIEHFIKKNRELAWQMLEGKPSQPVDMTSKGEKIELGGASKELIEKYEEELKKLKT